MLLIEVVAAAESRGVELVADGEMLRVRRVNRLDPETVETIRTCKAEILTILRDREAVVQRAEGILTENAAIREGKFPLAEPKFCGFHIGASGRDCKRCGGSWLEHYAPPSPSTRTKRGAR